MAYRDSTRCALESGAVAVGARSTLLYSAIAGLALGSASFANRIVWVCIIAKVICIADLRAGDTVETWVGSRGKARALAASA